ncbi:MAG: LysE family translocator [Methanobacteriaceae archaeon]|nr:LysE family translocator [Methanobacteriaceae archaeon]MDP2836926.1 LysE family translocator [Methanobacteriaceae archaeon]MDP3035736.1 LysE family translocator [Methanobacteriaceae archaeon]MDP3483894.1 LysE family translocator [Methanobacteriaceae archaeon]MDP3623246.1 LysE family translocator [Methanobacteriaceae archaeon]
MIGLLIAGISLGFSAGFSPGPLMVLIISQTLKHGYREGIKVACAPIITDIPIIIVTLILLSYLSQNSGILGLISIIGGFYLVYLAYESFKTHGIEENFDMEEPRSFLKGAAVNFLSPNPYIFWITVGGPITIAAYQVNPYSPSWFFFGFYIFLIGSKILLAVLVGKSRDFLTGKSYIYIMRFMGVLLSIFAAYIWWNGFHLIIG